MNPTPRLLTAILFSAEVLHAAEVVSTDWTDDAAAADQSLMGDFQGDGSIKLQDHGNAIRYCKTWIIPAK